MRPIGHLSISYLLARACPRVSTPFVLAGGLLPDIDFVLLPLPFFGKVHRVLTHNFAFVLGASLLAGLVAPPGRQRAAGLGLALGATVHLLIDADMFPGAEPGEACALLYPFDRRQVSRFRWKPPRAAGVHWQHPARDLLHSLRGISREFPFLAAALLVWMFLPKDAPKCCRD